MVDRAFPDLEEATKETLVLNQYLAQLGGAQIALSMRQQRPKMLVEAVSFTIKMESYLHKPHKVAHVDVTEEASPIAAIQTQQGAMMGILEDLSRRLQNCKLVLPLTQPSELSSLIVVVRGDQ